MEQVSVIDFVIQIVLRICGVRLAHRAAQEAFDSVSEIRSRAAGAAGGQAIAEKHEQLVAALLSGEVPGQADPKGPVIQISGAANAQGNGVAHPLELPSRPPGKPEQPAKRRGRPPKSQAALENQSSFLGNGVVVTDSENSKEKESR
jgi:hypothetical protein